MVKVIDLFKNGVIRISFYNESNRLFVNATEIYQWKSKVSEIKDFTLSLGNVSKKFAIINMNKTRLKGIVILFLLILILFILTIL